MKGREGLVVAVGSPLEREHFEKVTKVPGADTERWGRTLEGGRGGQARRRGSEQDRKK